jgi:hypothetical protein
MFTGENIEFKQTWQPHLISRSYKAALGDL